MDAFNSWKIPSAGIQLEGKATPEVERRQKEYLEERRSNWKLTERSMSLFYRLRRVMGSTVIIQLWEPIMEVFEDDGPLPFCGKLTGMSIEEVKVDGRYYPQLYIQIQSPYNILNGNRGEDPLENKELWQDEMTILINCSDIFTLEIINTDSIT